jgi:hypothetical protein
VLKDLLRGGEEVPLSEADLRALLEIEAANLLEQLPPVEEIPAERRQRWLERWQQARPFLSQPAYESVVRTFQDA